MDGVVSAERISRLNLPIHSGRLAAPPAVAKMMPTRAALAGIHTERESMAPSTRSAVPESARRAIQKPTLASKCRGPAGSAPVFPPPRAQASRICCFEVLSRHSRSATSPYSLKYSSRISSIEATDSAFALGGMLQHFFGLGLRPFHWGACPSPSKLQGR